MFAPKVRLRREIHYVSKETLLRNTGKDKMALFKWRKSLPSLLGVDDDIYYSGHFWRSRFGERWV